jgi:glycerophosphoryl diester phosphodiesterase
LTRIHLYIQIPKARFQVKTTSWWEPFLGLIFLCGCLLGCSPTPDKIDNLNHGIIFSVGHGGPGIQNMFTFIPHNTLEGYKKACKRPKLDGVEMDVQMSSDQKLILFHDKKLSSKVYQTGLVVEHSFDDLISYTYALGFYNFNRGNYHLAGLEATLTELKNMRPHGVFVLDLKLYPGQTDEGTYLQAYATELVNIIHRTQTAANVCIESTNDGMLRLIQALDPHLHLFLYTSDIMQGIEVATQYKFYGITIKYTKATRETVKLAHEKGLRVSLWGPRSMAANTACIQLQPDYIQTDKINDLLNKLSKYQVHEYIR